MKEAVRGEVCWLALCCCCSLGITILGWSHEEPVSRLGKLGGVFLNGWLGTDIEFEGESE